MIWNRKNVFLLYLVFFISFGTIAQTNKDSVENEYPNVFIFSPLNLFDVINPSFQVGYERSFSHKISVQVEGGIIMKRSLFGFFFTSLGFGTPGSWWTNSGYKGRLELKYYLKDERSYRCNPYVSGELFYTRNRANVTESYIVKDSTYDYSNTDVRFDGDGIYTDFFQVNKERIGFNLKFGLQLRPKYKEHFVLEPYIGIGIVHRNTTQSGRANLNDEVYDDFFGLITKEGKRWFLNVPVNLKLCYKF